MVAYATVAAALLPMAYGLADCKTHPLLDPSCWTLTAPDAFNVTWTFGTLGDVDLHVERAWSPLGVDRFVLPRLTPSPVPASAWARVTASMALPPHAHL